MLLDATWKKKYIQNCIYTLGKTRWGQDCVFVKIIQRAHPRPNEAVRSTTRSLQKLLRERKNDGIAKRLMRHQKKRLFISLVTRDITLIDALLDLVDKLY